MQMADAPLMAMDVLQWARHHRNFPGQGQVRSEVSLSACDRIGAREGLVGEGEREVLDSV